MPDSSLARIKITLGALSLEYEGQQSFIEKGLTKLAEEIYNLYPEISQNSLPHTDATSSSSSDNQTTNTIAQVISAKTGSDLALAAIARINLIMKNPVATRGGILNEMKEATTYFKDTYASNLTSYLDTLVKSRKVNLVARSSYALAAGERARLEGALLSA